MKESDHVCNDDIEGMSLCVLNDIILEECVCSIVMCVSGGI